MKIEISNYLRAKIIYFKIYSSKIFEGQKKSLIGPDPARLMPTAVIEYPKALMSLH